jgi:hypothetical protein
MDWSVYDPDNYDTPNFTVYGPCCLVRRIVCGTTIEHVRTLLLARSHTRFPTAAAMASDEFLDLFLTSLPEPLHAQFLRDRPSRPEGKAADLDPPAAANSRGAAPSSVLPPQYRGLSLESSFPPESEYATRSTWAAIEEKSSIYFWQLGRQDDDMLGPDLPRATLSAPLGTSEVVSGASRGGVVDAGEPRRLVGDRRPAGVESGVRSVARVGSPRRQEESWRTRRG